MLTLFNVSKSYKHSSNNIKVLSEANLILQQGQIIAIMGRSGSGKSTLLSLISGIIQPDHGTVSLNGKSFGELSTNQLSLLRASQIGFIFQNFHLVSYLNAFENVMLPGKVCHQQNVESRSRDLLVKVGLGHRLNHFPSELSGGEKQRVGIARALIHTPGLILADEPSGSLDQQTGEEVMDLLFAMVKAAQTSLILVTHDKKIAERCQQIYEITKGQLVLNEN